MYSTFVKCDSAPCLYVSNYTYELKIRVIADPANNTMPDERLLQNQSEIQSGIDRQYATLNEPQSG